MMNRKKCLYKVSLNTLVHLLSLNTVDDAMRFVQSYRIATSNAGYPHLQIVEPIIEVNETKRKNEVDKLLTQSNAKVVTINNTF